MAVDKMGPSVGTILSKMTGLWDLQRMYVCFLINLIAIDVKIIMYGELRGTITRILKKGRMLGEVSLSCQKVAPSHTSPLSVVCGHKVWRKMEY